jgi:hypothetical protein
MELTGISKGKLKKPYLLLMYGPDGVGKSTFGSEAPDPIFVGPESGSNNLDVARFTGVDSWPEVRRRTNELLLAKHSYKTVVFDSLDWMEPLLWKTICKPGETIEDALGSFGRGYTRANEIWKEFMLDVSKLRETRGMNVVLIAHSMVKTFNDPSQPLPYDRYMLKLNDKASAIWREFVDCVLFVNYQTTVFKANKSDKKGKTEDGGPRKIYTNRSAAYDAKNRLDLPDELALSFAAFDQAAQKGRSAEELLLDISDLAGKLTEEVRTKMLVAVEKYKGDAVQLAKIRNHARVIVGEAS